MTLTIGQSRILGGKWEAVVTGASTPPNIAVRILGEELPNVNVREADGGYRVSCAIPSDYISDGIQTFLVIDAETDETIGDFVLVCGDVMEEDIRAEVAQLRAELDLLKRAFRRHCVETAS